jgi:FkbM family methyltransferase
MLKNLVNLLTFVWSHPLNRGARFAAIGRVLRWQIASRLIPGPIALPFVNGTYLFTTRGMRGATGNWYCGLHEYEDMSFVMHSLRSGGLFVDVGANIGSYSILAAGETGVEVIAIEPIPSTFRALRRNVVLNEFSDRIQLLNIGLGKETGVLHFTADLDTVNHVLAEREIVEKVVTVPMRRLDDVLDGRVPVLIKIDVEGFESEVIAGAQRTLSSPVLQAVIMEVNGSGARYGFNERDLYKLMFDFQFKAYTYKPDDRRLVRIDENYQNKSNIIFAREVA